MNEDPFVEKLKKLRASGEKTEGTGGTKSEGKEDRVLDELEDIV